VTRTTLALAASAAVAMLVYCVTHLEPGTDITNFLPDRGSADLATISTQLADSALTRTIVLSIEGPTTAEAVAAAQALAGPLGKHPEVAWVRSGIDPDLVEHVYDVYFPRRHYFLSSEPERELPRRLDRAALGRRAAEARQELAGPASPLLKRILTADPLGAFRSILARARDQQPMLRAIDGQFVSADGRAILFVRGRASAFDSRPQTRLLRHVEDSFAAVAARHPGISLEQSSIGRFAAATEASMQQDVRLIASCSFVGVAVLFMLFLRSPARFAICSIPALAGILTATTMGLLWKGTLDSLTIAFGASLIGIAIDYPIHVLVHRSLAPTGEASATTIRRLRGSLTVAALTTMASFAGLIATSFPGFREIGSFAIVGIAVALAVTLTVVPALLGSPLRVPSLSVTVAGRLAASVARLSRWRRWLLPIPIVCLVGAPFAIRHLAWVDDLSRLTEQDPTLAAEDRRVRERVSQLDPGRFVVGIAPTADAAVALSDRIGTRLARVVEEGSLGGTRSLHALLWSTDLQRRNWETLTADAALVSRVEAAFVEAGFRAHAFDPFRKALTSAPPPPLTMADLEATPLADLTDSLLFELGDRTAVVTYLRDLRDPDAVRAALADLDDVHLFEQRSFLNDIYGEFRVTTLRQIMLGTLFVALVLLVRYRHWRPALAAFLPSVLVALIVLSAFALFGVETNLLHAVSLILVMGMGVDYGIFIVDSAHHRRGLEATMLSLLVSCLTTVFVFGTLALSEHQALRALGMTTGLGILLSLLLAPVSLVLVQPETARP